MIWLTTLISSCSDYISTDKLEILSTLHETHFSAKAQMCMTENEKISYATNNLAIRRWKAK
jgi:hypothetical protein